MQRNDKQTGCDKAFRSHTHTHTLCIRVQKVKVGDHYSRVSPSRRPLSHCQQDGVYAHENIYVFSTAAENGRIALDLFKYRKKKVTETRTHSPCGSTVSLHGIPAPPMGGIFIQQPLGLW